MGKVDENSMNSSGSSVVSVGDYAPSPNTCSQALTRANQLRVQALLRQLLVVNDPQRLDTLRVLRKTMRELDYHLSWLTQVDFLETVERILRDENESDTDWRLINDCSQLLIESIPRIPFDLDTQTVSQIFSSVVQNLGHQRSEVRRSSLLLINMYLNERPAHFQHILKIFIDYGLANYKNQQAQRGAILSLPLLMTEQVVEGEDLLPLVRCLSELLVDANSQLFYSLYLALQRLHLTVGDQQFAAYLRQCDPEATLLYKQAASRNNSIIATSSQHSSLAAAAAFDEQQQQPTTVSDSRRKSSTSGQRPSVERHLQQEEPIHHDQTTEPKQVTFENDQQRERRLKQQQIGEQQAAAAARADSGSDGTSNGSLVDMETAFGGPLPQSGPIGGGSRREGMTTESSSSTVSSEKSSTVRHSSTGQPLVNGFVAQSSVSSTCSSEANLVDPSHYMNADALSGRPLLNYDQIHHVDHSNIGLAINDLGVCCTPTIELGPAAQNELKFGIFPRHLVTTSLSSRYLDRLEALQEMMCIIRESPINHLAILMTYFDSFLEQFLARLMEPGTDYKVELIAIDMIETIVIKTKVSTMQYVRPMVSLLIRTLADSRSTFRDNTIRVIHKMMAFLPPQHVIDAIFEHKHNKSALVREESVNRVTAAVLEYDKNEFNLTKLCYHVLPMLADHHANVRLASLECIATLANALGPERIGSLLTAAEAVQTGCDYDGLLDAIHARLMRRTLPRSNSDGSIRYAIKPFLNLANANYHQEHQAADVRWILEAPSSHQHVIQHPQQQQQQQHAHHHAHRPGVYSPPDAEQRRRSSVSLSQLTAAAGKLELASEHSHHHSVSPASQATSEDWHHRRLSGTDAKQTESDSPAYGSSKQQPQLASGRRPSRSGDGAGNCTPGSSQTNTADHLVHVVGVGSGAGGGTGIRRAEPGGGGGKRRASGSEQGSNRSEINNIRQQQQQPSKVLDEPASGGDDDTTAKVGGQSVCETEVRPTRRQSVSQDKSQRRGSSRRRSISQDSASSSDTILPSDSIIYTDTVQAYALSRHQSRYQQTSFDYDHDYPAGRGGAPTASSSTVGPLQQQHQQYSHQGQKHEPAGGRQSRGRVRGSKHSLNQADREHQQQQLVVLTSSSSAASSGSDSPLTVMEASGSAAAGDRRTGEQEEETQLKQQTGSGSRRASATTADMTQPTTPERRASRPHLSHEEQAGSTESMSRRKSFSTSKVRDGTESRRQSMASAGASKAHHPPQEKGGGGHLDESGSGRRRSSMAQHQQQLQHSKDNDQDSKLNVECDINQSGRAQQKMGSGDSQFSERQRQLHRSQATVEEPQLPAADHHNQQQQQQSSRQATRRSLTRQSASVLAYDDDGEIYSIAATRTSNKDDEQALPRRSLQSSGRQDSMTTTDSQQSSPPDSTDHATQTEQRRTVPAQVPGDGGEHSSQQSADRRESRRRKSSRRSSSTRTHDDEPLDVAAVDSAVAAPQRGRVSEREEQLEIRRRASRSQPPPASQRAAHHQQMMTRTPSKSHLHDHHHRAAVLDSKRAVSVSPSVASSVNIRHILENVAQVEGAFQEPQLAFKVAMDALEGPCWSTKVEGILALIRLATFHHPIILAHLHEVVCRTAAETRNLRSTVARSAIFALGDYCAKLKHPIEPELDIMVQALLQKSIENTAFIRDDIRRAFASMVEHLTQWRLANSLINHGASHKNMHVRRMASQYVALLVERMGAAKCLVGARDISAQLLPAAAKFAQDSSPHTRYYGRLILARIMQHSAFERLLRKSLTPNLYRSTIGIIESVKRRGTGDVPVDN